MSTPNHQYKDQDYQGSKSSEIADVTELRMARPNEGYARLINHRTVHYNLFTAQGYVFSN